MEDHLAYLDALGPLIARRDDAVATLVLGDFNQRIPRSSAPIRVAEALTRCLGDLVVALAGVVPVIERQVIDHIACSPGLRVEGVVGFDRRDRDGRPLSNHDGVGLSIAGLGPRPVGGPGQSFIS